jgi:hypothetical protein
MRKVPIRDTECLGDVSLTMGCSWYINHSYQSRQTMSEEDFGRNYERMSDDELVLVLADRKDLVPEAASALDHEVQRRKVKLAEPTRYVRHTGEGEQVASLEDYSEYRELRRRSQFWGRYGYVVAIVPFVLLLTLGRLLGTPWFDDSPSLVITALSWAVIVCLYALSVFLRLLAFKCPQCGRGFGRGAECFNCRFPKGKKT